MTRCNTIGNGHATIVVTMDANSTEGLEVPHNGPGYICNLPRHTRAVGIT
eukprot:CAMPEP_0170906016 /NCGR_PEP_ID=MMETSP0735-20130129/429_1 /TAXON_ID=186038 /ORGANISM="Fragilariopsis kerguelensis, Strain L26-C5" /LENGTH=49 /DNA_ID= /DNA_START= /DNA_END= /DNA_ORIENTATION=